jgi:hypothetical protein
MDENQIVSATKAYRQNPLAQQPFNYWQHPPNSEPTSPIDSSNLEPEIKTITGPKNDTIRNFEKILTYFKSILPTTNQLIPSLEETCSIICRLCMKELGLRF